MVKYFPAWLNRKITGGRVFYDEHKSAGNTGLGVLAVLAVLGTGYGVHRYAQRKADAARQEERQAATMREQALNTIHTMQLATQVEAHAASERAARRRTNFQACTGPNRYGAGMTGWQKVCAGFSGRYRHTDNSGKQKTFQNGYIARLFGGVDGLLRGTFTGAKNITSGIPVVNYGTRILDGGAEGVACLSTGAICEIGESSDNGLAALSKPFFGGYNSMKVIDAADPKASLPAVNTVDPKDGKAAFIQWVGSIGRAALFVNSVCGDDDSEGDNGDGSGTDCTKPDLEGTLNGGDEFKGTVGTGTETSSTLQGILKGGNDISGVME